MYYQVTVFKLSKQDSSKQLMNEPTNSLFKARKVMFDYIETVKALDLVRNARKDYHGIKLPKIKSIIRYNYQNPKDKVLYMIYLHESES